MVVGGWERWWWVGASCFMSPAVVILSLSFRGGGGSTVAIGAIFSLGVVRGGGLEVFRGPIRFVSRAAALDVTADIIAHLDDTQEKSKKKKKTLKDIVYTQK